MPSWLLIACSVLGSLTRYPDCSMTGGQGRRPGFTTARRACRRPWPKRAPCSPHAAPIQPSGSPMQPHAALMHPQCGAHADPMWPLCSHSPPAKAHRVHGAHAGAARRVGRPLGSRHTLRPDQAAAGPGAFENRLVGWQRPRGLRPGAPAISRLRILSPPAALALPHAPSLHFPQAYAGGSCGCERPVRTLYLPVLSA